MADYWTDKRVTITGGAGFIGSHLALDLVNRGSIGCMLFFCEPDRHQHVIGSLSSLLHIPFRFENEGSQLILNEP